jgi:hypothetical protein
LTPLQVAPLTSADPVSSFPGTHKIWISVSIMFWLNVYAPLLFPQAPCLQTTRNLGSLEEWKEKQ